MMTAMATDPALGTRIRKRRQQLRLTQKELARRLGVDPSSVASWEKGEHFPQRNQGALEAELGISLDEEERKPEIPAAIRDAVRRSVAPEAQERVLRAIENVLSGRPADDDPDVTLHAPLDPRQPAPSGPARAASLIPAPASLSPLPRIPQPAGQPGPPA
jgi:transcriptional regulator with XRE-family HTH domain